MDDSNLRRSSDRPMALPGMGQKRAMSTYDSLTSRSFEMLPSSGQRTPMIEKSKRYPRRDFEGRRTAGMPWGAFSALIIAILCIVGSILIVLLSTNKEISYWTIQPTVYLAIASALIGVTLRLVFAEGMTVAWWRSLAQKDQSIRQLHKNWSYGNSLFSVFKAGRDFNLLALASLLVAFLPATGPLLQRASHVTYEEIVTQTNVTLDIAQDLPKGFTGLISGRAHNVAFLNGNFTPIVANWSRNAPITATNTNCKGTCTAKVPGLGWQILCKSSTFNYQLDPSTSTKQAQTVFSTSFEPPNFASPSDTAGDITANVQFKDQHDCKGVGVTRNCTLHPAVVLYPVVIDSATSTVTLDSTTTILNDTLVADVHPDPGNMETSTSQYGGFYLALYNAYSADAQQYFAGAAGWTMSSSGALASSHISWASDEEEKKSGYSFTKQDSCATGFTDPTDEILAAARDLMFRTAMGVPLVNGSSPQTVSGQGKQRTAVYKSQLYYLIIAIVLDAVAIIVILPLFYQYWKLDRGYTMSPVEVAKAFDSPILRDSRSNADAAAIIREMGAMGVRYERIHDGDRPVLKVVRKTETW